MTFHRNYDPGLVFINFKGVDLTGFAKGTFIKAARDEDTFKVEVGAGGDSTFVRVRSRSGTVELSLLQGAPSNSYLAGIIFNDELFGNGEGPLFIKDLNGDTLVEDQNARLSKPAETSFADGLENRDHKFLCPQMTLFTGGAVS